MGAVEMAIGEDIRSYFSLFDTFTGTGIANDEDWVWHILLQYMEDGASLEVAKQARDLLRGSLSDEMLLTVYGELGGRVGTTNAARVRRFLETTIELVPHSVAIRSALPEDTDDAWTRTPRPRLARESSL